MKNLLDELTQLLAKEKKYTSEGNLLKNKIIEAALKLDPSLIKMILKSENLKKHFFTEVDKILVFDKVKFQKFVNNKEFLPDSYTAFKNKIGLTDNSAFLVEQKNIVLAWPYKDCVLEGNQTKDEQKQNEVFWNEMLASDEIDLLLERKAFTNFKKFDDQGEKNNLGNFSLNDNLIIKGNNLLTLHSLANIYSNKIRLIYIDPPYNTGNDSFNYNDSFNHSTWLTFMKNRLSIARELLSDDGSIWINIDDEECHYLKVICDEIFGRENFVINFIWQKKYSPANDAKWFSDNHDHILVFAKNKKQFRPNLLPRSEEMNKRYANPDNDPRGPWKSGGFSVKTYTKAYDYPIKTPSGKIVYPPKGSCWQTSKQNYLNKLKNNRIYFGPKGDSKPQIKQFLSEVQQGMVCKSIWTYDEVGHNQVSRSEIVKLFGEFVFSTPKPEKLLKRILDLGTNEGDIVLDFFLGSGTTAAVAHKMKRKYIGIEQMDYIEDVAVTRLKKVIKGEQGGISREVNWKGGGEFKFFEMIKLNASYLNKLRKASKENQINDLFRLVKKSPYLNYKFTNLLNSDLEKLFFTLSFVDRKKFIADLLDKNMLYLCYSEIDDDDYGVSNKDIKLNKDFYSVKA